MNLSIRNYAAMALVGIASASSDDGTVATCGSVSLPDSAQYADRNWTEEQQANFNYLSQCSGAGGVTMAVGANELVQLKAKLVASGDLADLGQASDQQFFNSLDLDSDGVITRREFMQYMRSVKAPINLAGLTAPYSQRQNELFKYMSCAYDEQDCTSMSYTEMLQRTVSRANFKAMTPILKPGLYGNEQDIDWEMSMRDFDEDGVIDQEENGQYVWHYGHMIEFWNTLKNAQPGAAQRAVDQPIADGEIMTRTEWINQQNPWLARDYPAGAQIPERELRYRFLEYDLNDDGELTFDEAFESTHIIHQHWVAYQRVYTAINQDGNSHLDADEIRAYVTAENPGMTAAEIDAESAQLMTTLNRNQDAQVENFEGWMGYLGAHYERRRVHDPDAEREGFVNGWYSVDTNRDQLITEAEAIVAPVDHLELFALLQSAVNDNNEIEFEPAVEHWTTIVAPRQRLTDQLWEEAVSPGTIADLFQEDARILKVLELTGQPEEINSYNLAIVLNLLERIDDDNDGQISRRDICAWYVGDYDLTCGPDV